MIKFKKVRYITIIGMIFISTALSMALVSKNENQGTWPENWPKELEPYRKQARTIEIAAGNQENVYEIYFEKRDDFEKIWPVILKLKDKGGPLKLRSIEVSATKHDSLLNNEKPTIRIYSPAYNSSTTTKVGKVLLPYPPWPESIKSERGELPEYVTISEDGFIPFIKGTHQSAFIWRARIDIELVVDGNVIDLNRFRLPRDTAIIDERKF